MSEKYREPRVVVLGAVEDLTHGNQHSNSDTQAGLWGNFVGNLHDTVESTSPLPPRV